MPEEELKLENLGEGVADALFQIEMQKVVDNIKDPNIEPEAVRKITMEVTFRPTKNRMMGGMTIAVTSKLGNRSPHEGMAHFAKDQTGRNVIVEENPNQGKFEFPQDGVIPINKPIGGSK